MSFYEQERALLELVFDAELRESFKQQGIHALAHFQLTETELQDFSVLRCDALVMDAAMRSNLILTQLCRNFPLSFSLLSALDDGIHMLQQQINVALMQASPIERPALFGQQLEALLQASDYLDQQGFIAAIQIVAAETQLAVVSAKRKFAQIAGTKPVEINISAQWQKEKIALSDDAVAVVLPHRYSVLLQALCPVSGNALWGHLKKMPLPRSLRDELLLAASEQLLLAKAVCRDTSRCDPQVHLATAELSAGFIPIFHYIDGSMSCNEVLAHLQQAGAGRDLLVSVQKQLQQLLQTGFLQLQ